MTHILPVRGMPDVFPPEARQQDHIVSTAVATAHVFGFEKIQTPLLEPIEVFKRAVGETADIVSKEMYTLKDRNDKELCLRPEATASVMRAVLSNKLTHQLPLKYFYAGPMFRYERPQKGRLRQFTQIGVEHLGDTSPFADVECIALGWQLLQRLGINDIVLEINTLGDEESRQAYKEALVTYFNQHKNTLSPESQTRLEKNPLRILDSKDPTDQSLCDDAPQILDFLSPSSRQFFEEVCANLTEMEIPYKITPRLVRGLDYYCHTTFEFKTQQLGAQSTVLAGGRYNGLSQMLGGPEIPAVGWAAGVERISLVLPETPPVEAPSVMVAAIDETDLAKAMSVGHMLRTHGIQTQVSYKASLKHSLKKADKLGMSHLIILGPDELAAGTAQVRNLHHSTQETIPLSSLINHVSPHDPTAKQA